MKKALAILLSVIMMFGVMPFATFATDTSSYERYKVSANDVAYIDELSAEQIAAVLLDWVDRQIAAATADFETFEVEVYGQTIALEIPEIKSIDDIMQYATYLKELGGDFETLEGTDAFAALTRANGNLNFIYGVFDFMAANADKFGKVFRWDGVVIDEKGAVTSYGNGFDYGKVGDYIEGLNGSKNADEQAIYDFYIKYLVKNDIQTWFQNGVLAEMDEYYKPTTPDATFDEAISNGIIAWVAALCKDAGILSEKGLATLKAYDLREADIYAHVKNFVGLVQSDNQVKINTYYNFLLDTAVRTLLKTMLGQKAEIGADVAVPASFAETYTDLALLAEISGGTVNYKDGDAYYQITITDGVATAKTLKWVNALDINMDPPVVNIYTGAGLATPVQTYKPNNPEFTTGIYSSARNQALMAELVPAEMFAGTEVPSEAAAIMVDANAKALTDGVKIETIIDGNTDALEIAFAELETMAEEAMLITAQAAAQAIIDQSPFPVDVTVEGVDVSIEYKGWATEDDFIAQALVGTPKAVLGGSMASFAQGMVDTAIEKSMETYIDNPVVTIVVDKLTGGKYDLEKLEALMNYIDTDFVIDDSIIDIAGNYNAYDGAVGQVNHILVGLVNMLVSDSGEADLALVDGKNTNLYANLEKIAAKSDEVIDIAKELLSDEQIKAIFNSIGIDALFGSDHGFNLDMILGLDFSDVESMIVCGIEVVLDFIDDGKNALVAELHDLVEGLETLDAMAIAVANAKAPAALADINTRLGTSFVWTAPEAATVADGAAKDIIMTNLADMAYEAAEFVVAKLNTVANDTLAKLSTETGAELPKVAFKLDVAKGATWMETLTNLTNRAYELAGGIIIACKNAPSDTFGKISAVLNAVLPTEAMLSNASAKGFAVDVETVVGYLFDDAFEANFNGILGLAEVKEDAIAGGVPVTGALVNACEHIVDAIFPGTVQTELEIYDLTSTTIQEVFTGAESDQAIAAGNMISINEREAELVPAVLNLVRESGTLPFFAKCDNHIFEATEAKAATCIEAGYEAGKKCTECGYVEAGAVIPVDANNHTNIKDVAAVAATCTKDGATAGKKCADCGKIIEGCAVVKATHKKVVDVAAKAATCTAAGYTAGKKCEACGATISGLTAIPAKGHEYVTYVENKAPTCTAEGSKIAKCENGCGAVDTQPIAAKGHADADKDNECDVCGDEISSDFFAKIKAFFQKIINWFKNLFS